MAANATPLANKLTNWSDEVLVSTIDQQCLDKNSGLANTKDIQENRKDIQENRKDIQENTADIQIQANRISIQRPHCKCIVDPQNNNSTATYSTCGPYAYKWYTSSCGDHASNCQNNYNVVGTGSYSHKCLAIDGYQVAAINFEHGHNATFPNGKYYTTSNDTYTFSV